MSSVEVVAFMGGAQGLWPMVGSIDSYSSWHYASLQQRTL